MAHHEINLRLGAKDEASGKIAKVSKASSDFTVNIKKLGSVFGSVGSIFGDFVSNIAKGGVWGIAQAGVNAAFSAIKAGYESIRESIEQAQKTADENLDKMVSKIGEYKSAVMDAADAARKAAEATLAARRGEIELTERLTKASVELARQKRIAAGEDAAKVNAESDAALTDASATAARSRSDAEINAAIKRVSAAEKARDEAEAELEHLRNARAMVDDAELFNTPGNEETYKKAKAYEKALDKKILEARRAVIAADDRVQSEEKTLADAQTGRDALEKELEAAELKRVNDRKAEEEAAARAAAEKRAEAERKSAEKVAAERARLDREEAARRERERQAELAAKIKDLQRLSAEEQKTLSAAHSRVADADVKLDQAWGWYRDKDSLKAQLDEERANAEAEKQFEKDLDSLQRRKGSDWRRAKNLSVDDEAVRRVALAREEKNEAEKHLAEIEKNTADLAAKLDQLLQVKG